jgi:hypothetical protein
MRGRSDAYPWHERVPVSDNEADEMEDHLRGLGYIE